MQIPGVRKPLTEEEASSFYRSLVLPLRKEYEILSNEFLKSELVESDPDPGTDVAEVLEETPITGTDGDN